MASFINDSGTQSQQIEKHMHNYISHHGQPSEVFGFERFVVEEVENRVEVFYKAYPLASYSLPIKLDTEKTAFVIYIRRFSTDKVSFDFFESGLVSPDIWEAHLQSLQTPGNLTPLIAIFPRFLVRTQEVKSLQKHKDWTLFKNHLIACQKNEKLLEQLKFLSKQGNKPFLWVSVRNASSPILFNEAGDVLFFAPKILLPSLKTAFWTENLPYAADFTENLKKIILNDKGRYKTKNTQTDTVNHSIHNKKHLFFTTENQYYPLFFNAHATTDYAHAFSITEELTDMYIPELKHNYDIKLLIASFYLAIQYDIFKDLHIDINALNEIVWQKNVRVTEKMQKIILKKNLHDTLPLNSRQQKKTKI